MVRVNHLAILSLAAAALTFNIASASNAPTPPAAAPNSANSALDGTWLAESASYRHGSELAKVWGATFTIRDGRFVVSPIRGTPGFLKGRFILHPGGVPGAIDLAIEPVEIWKGDKYPACTLPGIFKVDQNILTVCLATGSKPQPPSNFLCGNNDEVLLTLARAHAGFAGLPAHVLVTIKDDAGKPVAGAHLFSTTYPAFLRKNKDSPKPQIKFVQIAVAAANGTVQVPYDAFKYCPLAAHDSSRNLIGITPASPASLQDGTASLQMAPACLVSGTLECEEMAKAAKPVEWTYIELHQDGVRIGSYGSFLSEFEFPVSPGSYEVMIKGKNIYPKYVPIVVPAGVKEFRVPSVAVTASNLIRLEEQMAPELQGVAAWKGRPVKLADQRGKVVLIDFWGYWCGPCIHAMPALIQAHNQFKDRGLVIIGVHCDLEGRIDNVAKYDAQIAPIKNTLWKGADLPFSIALVAGAPRKEKGQRLGDNAQDQYGVHEYPTTIAIDRQGHVVGEIQTEDSKQFLAELEKLLNAKS